jgi:hypothetical protein
MQTNNRLRGLSRIQIRMHAKVGMLLAEFFTI